MTQEFKAVTLLGATGNLGPHILSSLLRTGFEVTVLSRSQSSAASKLPSGVRVRQSDYSFASLVEAFKGQDVVVSTISTLNVQQQLNIIDAAVAAKVKRFVPSEFGSDTSVDDEDDMATFIKEKKEVVRHLRTKEASGLSWTALCPGPWIDWMLEEGNGLLGLDIKSKTATIVDSGDQEFTGSTLGLVAKATATILMRPEETKNRYLQVQAFTLTQKSIIEAVERVTNTKFSTKKISRAELLSLAAKHLDEGDMARGQYELVTATLCSGSKIVRFPERAVQGNKVLGLAEEEDLEEMIKRVLAKLENI
ncbi:putative 2`-hydroxyisoflavone reductase [Rosellinia necatrix]|uniref:Putative 2`-hydroxyisoflavone reductase n=1 Tax=Rosellinia necatrix TaxID=77044 RepID=A0A1W2TX16_ROSNE|nr:putative 2`-hydroxyisoflavone reductase [Rosellinia necatrix]